MYRERGREPLLPGSRAWGREVNQRSLNGAMPLVGPRAVRAGDEEWTAVPVLACAEQTGFESGGVQECEACAGSWGEDAVVL